MMRILTWLWNQPGGRTQYRAEHVNIWADMVRRHVTLPHSLACVTDIGAGIDSSISIIDPPREFEGVELPTWAGDKPQCLRRIAMFAPGAAETFGQRFVSMDLDCIISANLDTLFDRPEDIVLYASPPGTTSPRPYNGSMVMMTSGARPAVYNRFTPAEAVRAGELYAGSDQAWISHVLGAGEATWSERDGVAWWGRWNEGTDARLVFFPGSPKPWDLLDHYPRAIEHYHRSHGGRCLVLGHAASLWADVARALNGGQFDAVIASPEAAEHWPHPVLAIATTDAHAERLVRSIGFDDVVYCGRTEEMAA